MHPLYTISPLYGPADYERRGAAPQKIHDHRDAFERDRARIVHSFSFRRLQSKTQIFSLSESAFLRTRLTHSLEVANIGRALTAVINRRIWPEYPNGAPTEGYARIGGVVDTSVIEAACLAHDLGHPPFGHRGEEALNYCVWTRWPENGFEGNGQTLRLLSHDDLEVHGERNGLNLTRATLLAIVKYPRIHADLVNAPLYPSNASCPPFKPWAPPKCIHNEEAPLLDWLLEAFDDTDKQLLMSIEHRDGKHSRTLHKTLEAGIVELADDIAYGTHDVEDAFFSRMIEAEQIISYMQRDEFDDATVFDYYADIINRMGHGIAGHRRHEVYEKKRAGSELISRLISAVRLVENERFSHPRLRWNVTLAPDDVRALHALKRSVFDIVINGPAVQSLEYRGGLIIRDLFDALYGSPEVLSGKHGHLLREAEDEHTRIRVLADYISGMTDTYAERMYNRLFQPGNGSVFDRL